MLRVSDATRRFDAVALTPSGDLMAGSAWTSTAGDEDDAKRRLEDAVALRDMLALFDALDPNDALQQILAVKDKHQYDQHTDLTHVEGNLPHQVIQQPMIREVIKEQQGIISKDPRTTLGCMP